MSERPHNPDDIEFLISQALDDELDASKLADLEAALRTRPDVQAARREYETLYARLRGLPSVREPNWEQFGSAIRHECREELGRSRFRQWLWRAGSVAAAACLVLLATLVLRRTGPSSIDPSSETVAFVSVGPKVSVTESFKRAGTVSEFRFARGSRELVVDVPSVASERRDSALIVACVQPWAPVSASAAGGVPF